MIKTYHNFFSAEIFEKLSTVFKNPYMKYGWASSFDFNPHGHWNLDFAPGYTSNNLANIETLLKDVVSEAWQYAKENCEELKDTVLIRCYINGHTFGVDGYFHKDSSRLDEKTCVIYLNKEWNRNWAGETVFITNEETEELFSSLPSPNKAVIFYGNIPHCARGVSRGCPELRTTFMFKTREKRSETFEKLSTFLFENGATNLRHESGENHLTSSLHDHLVRVYQLLEDKKLPEKVCLGGGLHSIFGTNAFTNSIFSLDERNKVAEQFGEEACQLAELFSVINRPDTLENSNFVDGLYHVKLVNEKIAGLDEDTFESLRYMEAANLLDQKLLDKDNFPNLYNLWHSKG